MWEHWGTFQRKAKQKNINTREVPSYVFHFNLDIGFLVCRCHYRLNDRAVAKKKPDKNRASELRRQDSRSARRDASLAKNCDREHVKKTDVAKKKPDKNRAS